MRNRAGLNNLFSRDRKTLYIILSIVMVSVLTLTVVYAALSTTLNINGNAEVTAASWDIYLDNVVLNSNSTTTNVPTITDKTTASFSTTLSKPGDYYMFTVDVVNNGSIDAMINSVTKTPELTDTQKKYLNYIVEYQNGESITTKQLVEKKSFVRLKVRVEFRKDITVSDLPSISETLDLSFKVNYVQSDDSTENATIDNNGKLVKIVSGDGTKVGDEICIGQECFYVISSDEESVTMLAKYNLYVGGVYNGNIWTSFEKSSEAGIQSPIMLGWVPNLSKFQGVLSFSSTNYWCEDSSLNNYYGVQYPSYVFDSNSNLYNFLENYKIYLEKTGVNIKEARLIRIEELELLGCNKADGSCTNSQYSWVYATSYWTGTAYAIYNVFSVRTTGEFVAPIYEYDHEFGVRPVIKVLKSEF